MAKKRSDDEWNFSKEAVLASKTRGRAQGLNSKAPAYVPASKNVQRNWTPTLEQIDTIKPTSSSSSSPLTSPLRHEHVQSEHMKGRSEDLVQTQGANSTNKRIDYTTYRMTGPDCGSMDSEALFCDMVFQDDYTHRVQSYKNVIKDILVSEGFYIGEEFCRVKTEDKELLEKLSTTLASSTMEA